MLHDLIPEFFAILDAPDPESAYQAYFDAHTPILTAYWRNYVLDPHGPHASEVVATALRADRADLRAMLKKVDLAAVTREAVAIVEDRLEIDCPVDVVLMVGVGAANAGELVVAGRGTAFVCVEHFTGRANPSTWGMGLAPTLIPLWIAHEIAHCIRYTSPSSQSEVGRLVKEAGGYYDYWSIGSRAPLRELLLNEGLAVHAAQAACPGFASADYFGYPRRQYTRIRELESFLRRAAAGELDQAGLGLRLRYLTGGVSPATRMIQGKVLPERCGYYLGHRMAEALVQDVGIAQALRAPAEEFEAAEQASLGMRTA